MKFINMKQGLNGIFHVTHCQQSFRPTLIKQSSIATKSLSLVLADNDTKTEAEPAVAVIQLNIQNNHTNLPHTKKRPVTITGRFCEVWRINGWL